MTLRVGDMVWLGPPTTTALGMETLHFPRFSKPSTSFTKDSGKGVSVLGLIPAWKISKTADIN